MPKTLSLFLLFSLLAASAFGQCGPAGHMIVNPLTGAFDCTANAGVPPSGAAGGVLGGTFPDPTFASGNSFNADPNTFLNGAGAFTSPGTANNRCTFTTATTCSITGLTGVAANAVVSCYDTSSTLIEIIPNDFAGTTADTLVINFSAAQTGYCNASTGVGSTGAAGAAGATGVGCGTLGGSLTGTCAAAAIATLSQNLLFTDATYDIGASGATRPRDIFTSRDVTVGRNLAVGTSLSVDGTTGIAATSKLANVALNTITAPLMLTAGVPSASTAANIVGLFSTCSGTQYLGADGACHTPGATGANAALSNLSAVSINAGLIPQTTLSLGAQATPWQNLYIYGQGSFGTTSIKFDGTPTGNRTATFPDASITVARTDAGQTFTGVQTMTSPALTTPTITTSETLSNNGIAATSTDGYVLQNTTAATSGAQVQFSPRLHFKSSGWTATSGGSSQVIDWIAETQPTTAANNPTGTLVIRSQVNGGGYSDGFRLGTVPGFVSFGGTGGYAWGTSKATNNVVTLGRPDGGDGTVQNGVLNWTTNNTKIGANVTFSIGRDVASQDVILRRGGASGILDLTNDAVNGTGTAANFRIFASDDGAGNYARASLTQTASTFTIASESAGTGCTNCDIAFVPKGTGKTSTTNAYVAPKFLGNGTAPAVTNTSANSCGTTSATLAGSDVAGKVTVGATSGSSCTVTFTAAWTNAPSCTVTNETTANLVRATSTTTTTILAGVFVAGDVLAYQCLGF